MRKAIQLKAEKGITGEQAADLAGVSYSGFWKAWGQPHVQAFFEECKAKYIQRITSRKDVIRARAIEIGEDLMVNAQSEQVKARLVEFFAGEPRQPLVNISIPAERQGVYSYRRPTAIGQAPDQASGGAIPQAIEIEGKAVEVDPQPVTRPQGKA